MQQNVVLYAFPWYQPQLEPKKQFGEYIVTGLVHGRRGSGKEGGGRRRGGRREEGREGRRGDIPPSGADDCPTSVHVSRAHDDVVFYYSAIRNDVIILLHLYITRLKKH